MDHAPPRSPDVVYVSACFRRSRFCALHLLASLPAVSAAALAAKLAPTPPDGMEQLGRLRADHRRRRTTAPTRPSWPVSSSTGGSTRSSTKAGTCRTPSPTQLRRTNICGTRTASSFRCRKPLPFGGERGGVQAAGGLGPCTGTEIRHPHCARNSRGRWSTQNLPIAGSSFHAADAADTGLAVPLGRRQLGRERQRRRSGLLRLDVASSMPRGVSTTSRWTASGPSVPADRDPADRRGDQARRVGRSCSVFRPDRRNWNMLQK